MVTPDCRELMQAALMGMHELEAEVTDLIREVEDNLKKRWAEDNACPTCGREKWPD